MDDAQPLTGFSRWSRTTAWHQDINSFMIQCMRTTLTVDADIAAVLERLRRSEGKTLKELVNTALRRGLRETTAPAKPAEPSRTRPVSLGRCLIGDIVSVSEALALGEGEDFK